MLPYNRAASLQPPEEGYPWQKKAGTQVPQGTVCCLHTKHRCSSLPLYTRLKIWRDHARFLAMADQVLKTRAVAVGGVLKKYLREHADLTSEPGEEEAVKEAERLFFGWHQPVRRYKRLGGK